MAFLFLKSRLKNLGQFLRFRVGPVNISTQRVSQVATTLTWFSVLVIDLGTYGFKERSLTSEKM